MACVNPNDPRFLEILQQVGNPLLAEIEFDKLYPFEEERIADLESRMFEEPKISIKKILSENEIDEDLVVPLYKALNTGNKITAEDFPPDAYRSFKQFVNSLPINLDTKLTTNGKPTILFHGSPSKFGTFKEEFLGSYTNAPSAKQAFFAAKDISTAIHYGEKDKSALDQLGQLEGDNPEPDWEYEEYKYIMDLPEDDPKRIAYDAEQERIKKSENEAKGKYFVEEWQDNTRDERVTFYNKTNIYPLFFISKNPLIVDVKGNRKNIGSINKTLIQAKEDGYDAVVFKNIYDGGKGNTDVYTVFSSSQIVNIFDVINEQFLNEKRPIDIEEFKPIKEGVDEVFESNPELANSVYEALGFETVPVGWEKGKTLYDKAKPVKIDFKSGITTLPNGNYLVRAYRTDDTGLGSKGYGQRGEGLYLSLTNPYPGKNVNTVEFEISPSDIITYKEEFSGTIPYEKLTGGKGNFQDRVALAGGKAFIGGINSSEDPNLEIVLYDKTLINKALQSKKKVSNFTTKYLLYDLITSQQKQQAQQLYSQYLDTVFPESKVKDIVYRGTPENYPIKKGISASLGEGITFTSNKHWANSYTEGGNNPTLHTAIINIKNPIILKDNIGNLSDQEQDDYVKIKLKKENDGTISLNEYLVIEPEQIHILGNKEDIKGFQEFVVKNKQKETIDNVYVPLSEEHRQLLESARENLNPVEADRVEQMLKGETRFLDDSNFEMC